MKCNKCKSEVSSESKFCSNCGERIEESLNSSFDKTIDLVRKTWFILGFFRGTIIKGKRKPKWFKKFEEDIKTKSPEIWEDYQLVINFWREQAKKKDG